MFQSIYEWLREISVYLVLVTAVLHALPKSEYKKYVRFFTGLLLVILVMCPVFSLFGADNPVTNFYKGREYEAKLEEIEKEAQSLYQAGWEESDTTSWGNETNGMKEQGATEEYTGNSIKVEDIQID